MEWQEAEAIVQKHYSWKDQTVQYAEVYWESSQPDGAPMPPPEAFVGSFVTGPQDEVQAWLNGFLGYLPAEIKANKQHAEQMYNQLTGGVPQVPGQQYVQDNYDGSFTLVWTTRDLKKAQDGYNAVADNEGFVVGKRYVQANRIGDYSVVVRYPMDY